MKAFERFLWIIGIPALLFGAFLCNQAAKGTDKWERRNMLIENGEAQPSIATVAKLWRTEQLQGNGPGRGLAPVEEYHVLLTTPDAAEQFTKTVRHEKWLNLSAGQELTVYSIDGEIHVPQFAPALGPPSRWWFLLFGFIPVFIASLIHLVRTRISGGSTGRRA